MDKPATPYGDAHPTELSTPVPREEVHNRRISCNGFVREDGLYDIEAEITDNKTYPFPTEFRGDVTPDQLIHHMKVRVTLDHQMKVHAAEALTISGPYAVCPTANDVFESRTIPRPGQEFRFHDIRFRILKREGNKITSLRLWSTSNG